VENPERERVCVRGRFKHHEGEQQRHDRVEQHRAIDRFGHASGSWSSTEQPGATAFFFPGFAEACSVVENADTGSLPVV